MPFLTLNNDWSKLASLYNQNFQNKPEVPRTQYTSFDDGLVRGGVLNAGLASIRDTKRIGQFLASGKGVLFIAKQVGLQLSNPILEQPSSVTTLSLTKTIDNVEETILSTTLKTSNKSPNRIYNSGLNTITQIPLSAFGGHIIRQGTLPIFGGGNLEGSIDNIKGYNYIKITQANNALSISRTDSNSTSVKYKPSPGEQVVNIFATGKTEAEAQANFNFQKQKLIEQGKIPVNLNSETPQTLAGVALSSRQLSYKFAPNRLLQHLRKIQLKGIHVSDNITEPITLFSYNGGPDSTYGVGKTIIKTYPDQRTNVSLLENDPKNSLLNGFLVNDNTYRSVGYSQIDATSSELSPLFKRQSQTYIPNEDDLNVETRVGVSKINKKNNTTQRSVDAINTISIMDNTTFYNYAKSATSKNFGNEAYNDANQFGNSTLFTYTNGESGKVRDGNFARDIIKFRIEFINNDRINQTGVLAFRAYIDDFNDGMTAKWNSYRYMGRGEDFYVYDGFSRDISISFTIYAHSPEEMKPLYQKLNYLMSSFTPDYSSKLKMRGNIAKLTVGDYLYQQPGIFTDIKLSGMLDTHWEIAFDDELGGNSKHYEVPKHIKVSLTFKPIHNFLPRRVYAGNLTKAPFITRNDTNNKYLVRSFGDNAVTPKSLQQIKDEDAATLAKGTEEFNKGVGMGILEQRREL